VDNLRAAESLISLGSGFVTASFVHTFKVGLQNLDAQLIPNIQFSPTFSLRSSVIGNFATTGVSPSQILFNVVYNK